jgi:uncharacterized protein with von Willebrand factor type A (vWA) domain
VRLKADDIVTHKTRNTPKCASAVLLDMGCPMRYDEQHVNVKRMGLALGGLIRSECPGDFLQPIERYTFAKPRHASEVAALMYKPVTLLGPWVRKEVNRSDPKVSEVMVPPLFTNTQHGLRLARKSLAQNTPDRQVLLITDGLPAAHFESGWPYLLYPPDPRTEGATLREAQLRAREGITTNVFLLASWNQTPYPFGQPRSWCPGGCHARTWPWLTVRWRAGRPRSPAEDSAPGRWACRPAWGSRRP